VARKRGRNPERKAGQQRHANGEEHRLVIEFNFTVSRQFLRHEREQRRHAPKSEDKSRDAARERKQPAFSEQLANEPPPARA